ncbi:ComEA family DNA-binding protein [soil metagenome]
MPFADRHGRRPREDPFLRDRLDRMLAQARPELAEENDPWLEPVRGGSWRPRREEVQGAHDVEDHPPEGATEQVTGGRHRPVVGAAGHPRMLTVPASLRTSEVRVLPAAVVGMLLVVVLAGAVFGVRVWLAGQGARPEPVPPASPMVDAAASTAEGTAVSDAPDVPSAPSGAGAGADAVATPAPVAPVGHVSGAVARPGVVALPTGARVRDAVHAAGGMTGDAEADRSNLARPVADGEQVWVPVAGQEEPETVGPVSGGMPGPVAGGAGSGSAAGAGGGSSAQQIQVDLNTADQAGLEELPGVGPVTAGRILAWREEHGRFGSVEELLEVSGIGERTLEELRPHVTW